jgi:hypothetical protein
MRRQDNQSRMMIIVVGFVIFAGVVGAVFGDVGKALVVAVGTAVFVVVGIALLIRERRGG